MVYTPNTIRAMRIAYDAHKEQVDYNGVPYIFHPLHLAEQMDDEISCIVALLHDVVEDTAVTMEELANVFPSEVIRPLTLLTHTEDTEYFAYVRRIKSDPVAKKVKLADLDHNSDQSRCIGSDIPQEKLEYWRRKYEKARQILTEEE